MIIASNLAIRPGNTPTSRIRLVKDGGNAYFAASKSVADTLGKKEQRQFLDY